MIEDHEGETERAMWPLHLRVDAREDGWEITPWRPASNHYVMGWISFNTRGETLVEYIRSHMEAGTDPDLYDAAWAFYVWLSLQNRLRFKVFGRE